MCTYTNRLFNTRAKPGYSASAMYNNYMLIVFTKKNNFYSKMNNMMDVWDW
jgi:hypothetical protein